MTKKSAVINPQDVEQEAEKLMAQQGFCDIRQLNTLFNGQLPEGLARSAMNDLGYQSDSGHNYRYVDANPQPSVKGFGGFPSSLSAMGITGPGNIAGMVSTAQWSGGTTYPISNMPQPPQTGTTYDGKKTRTQEKKDKKVTLVSVVMPEKKREEIQSAISQIKNDELIFGDWGFDAVFEKGTAISLLFWGIPGTGKTLTAQAIADEVDGELKTYGTAEIQSSEPGGAERTIKEIFAKAKAANAGGGKKQVILFDECDSLLTDRNEVGAILGAQVNTLLSEIELYDGIIIFTTNRMGKLDPALERRISAKIEFEFPTKQQRLAIWKRMIPEKAPLAKDVDFDKLSDYPLAGGNIKNAVLNAARLAAYKKEKELTMAHFIEAIEREAKALQAFIAEYEAQAHSSLLGFVNQTAQGGLIVNQKATHRVQDQAEDTNVDFIKEILKPDLKKKRKAND